MMGEFNEGVVDSFQESLDFRRETLQAVLTGEMNPIERRLELVGRRPGIVFGATGNSLGGNSLGGSVGENETPERPERERSKSQYLAKPVS